MSLPRYSEYKDSGVDWLGEVPGHWDVIRLKNVLYQRITDGPHTTPTFLNDGVPFLSVDGIQDGELKFEGCRFISESDHEEYRTKALPRKDDLLMGKAASTGKIARVKVDFEFSIWSPLALIRLDQKLSNPAFYEQSLKSPIVQAQIDNLCTANTQKNISMDDIPKLILTRPPLTEQNQIAAFLDRETVKIDALIAEQQRLVELLAEKRQAVISHAVTKGLNPNARVKDSGIEWLGEVPEHWEIKRIKRLINSIEQGWSPQCEGFPVETPDEWGVLKVGCVNGGIFNPAENKTLPEILEPIASLGIEKNDVLISRANTRELVGSAAVARENYPRLMLCDKLYRLKMVASVCLPEFLVFYLGIGMVRGQIELAATGASSSMLNIGQSIILELEVALPTLEEQQTITAFLNSETAKFDTLTAEANRAIELLQERRSALISAAVTGKIDVRAFPPMKEVA